MAVSTSDIVTRVRDLLYQRTWETTSTTTTTSTTVAVPDGTQWSFGDIGEWQTGTVGYEQFFVQSVAANNLTVVRGYAGTTAETHTSGDRVLKNPKYTGRQITQAVTNTMNDLWPTVWLEGSVTLTPVAATIWYDLNAATRGIAVVRQQADSLGNVVWYGANQSGQRPFIFAQDLPTAVASTGKGLRFPGGLHNYTYSVNVIDKRLFTGTTDIPDTADLPVAECITYGACARLLAGTEIQRISIAENTDVEPSVRIQTSSYFKREFHLRRDKLAIAYLERYEPVRKWR